MRCLLLIYLCFATAVQTGNGASYFARPAAGGGGAIAFNAAGSGKSAVSATTLSFNVIITTATDGFVVVGAGGWDSASDAATITSATFDGSAMTALTPNAGAVFFGVDTRMFGLAIGNKAAGTYAVVVTYSTSYEERGCGAAVWNNVHQVTSIGTPPTATTGTSTTPSITATTAANEVVFDHLNWWNGTASVGANQTQRYNGGGGQTDAGGSSQLGSDGGVMSWALSVSDEWTMLAVSLKPANP